MARTLNDYLDIAEHTAGGQIDASIDLTQLVNDAGRYLVQMHDWAFLERPQATLNTVQDQAHLDLPSDFDKMLDVGTTADNDTEGVKVLPADQFERIKSSEITDLLDVYLSLEWPAQASTSVSAPGPRLAIYPTPSTSVTGKYWLNYRAGWIELTTGNAVANIPPAIEHLLIQIVRAFARGEATGEGHFDLVDKIESSVMLNRLKATYGLVNPASTEMEGGALQRLRSRHDGRQHTTITTKA